MHAPATAISAGALDLEQAGSLRRNGCPCCCGEELGSLGSGVTASAAAVLGYICGALAALAAEDEVGLLAHTPVAGAVAATLWNPMD